MKKGLRKMAKLGVVIMAVSFVLMSFTLSSMFSSKANVTIPAQQEFVLGEYENSNYRAKLHNKSNKEMVVKVVNKETNEQTQGFGLNAKGSATVYIRKYEKVLLKNPNDKDILVTVKMSKTVEGMRYQDLDAN